MIHTRIRSARFRARHHEPRDIDADPLPDAVRAKLETLRIDAPAPSRAARDRSGLVREAYPFRLDVRTRFGDLDTNRHVNNVRYACGLFDGSRCIGLAEAVGAHHAPDDAGDPVQLAARFEPFRMRKV